MDASINGLRASFDVSGPADGLPVVFLHAFPFHSAMWAPQVQALSASCRTVLYDVRGFGGSEPGDGQHTLEFFVDDLFALLDHLKLARPVLCGLSMGGYIALRAVERNPARFRALALCDTRSEADSDEAKVKRAAVLKVLKTSGRRAFADGFLKSVLAPQTFERDPGLVERMRGWIEESPPAGIAGGILALASRTDTTASLASLRLPALVMAGEKDPVTPPSAAQSLAARIAGAELHIVPWAGHISNLENPADFNRRLSAFLLRIPRS
jgi:pimeloyl-ACP methyl ester carboxylesterase